MGVEDGSVVATLERLPAREAFVEQAAERVDVGSTVDLVAADLLGRDVVDRAHQRCVAGGRTFVAETLRQPEISQVGMPAPVDQHVRRLDVPVHQPTLVRGIERAADLHRNCNRLLVGEWTVFKSRLQVRALDVAHRDVEAAVGIAGLVDRNHIRVIERGGELGLGQEPLAEALVLGQGGREQLQGDVALQAQVLGQVDDAHSSAPEDGFDPIVDDQGAARKLACGRHG